MKILFISIFMLITLTGIGAELQKTPPKASTPWKLQNMQRLVNKYADRYGIDKEHWYKLIELESSWHRKAVSKRDATGLCQIWPPTARAYGMKGSQSRIIYLLKNPAINISLCAKILRDLLKRYDGDWFNVAIAFNAGPGVVTYATKIIRAKSRVAQINN